MSSKKTIHIVCKSNTEDKFRLAREFWEQRDLNPAPKDLVLTSLVEADKATLESGECKWFYCPAYHFCPFAGEVFYGVKGRANKKKIDVKFDNITQQPEIPSNSSDFNFKDGVVDKIIKGDSIDDSEDETL